MNIALDIETIPNNEMIDLLPAPKVAKNLKDPAKIEAALADGRHEQIDKMALDPLTARICTYAVSGGCDDYVWTIDDASDNEAEDALICGIMSLLAKPDICIATWNGSGFDLPMIYKRAMILGIKPDEFGAPPLSYWTRRYSTSPHCDLMQVWANWSMQYAKLDTVASMVLGEKKDDIDVTKIIDMIQTDEGRDAVSQYCLRDTQLTWKLFVKMHGFLFNNKETK